MCRFYDHDGIIKSQNKICSLEILVVKSEVEASCCLILGLQASEKLKLIF